MGGFNNQSLRFINSRWSLPRSISHLIIFGQTGSGKSQTLKSCIERLALRGNVKILDLYAGGADEGAFYALKSDHHFWNERAFQFHDKVTEAMEFPVNCLIPMSKGIPKELPDIYTPFTIPINSIKENDLKSILGSDLTKGEVGVWRKATETINKNTSMPDLLNLVMETKKKKSGKPGTSGHGLSSIYNMFSAFERERLFSSANNKLALDLKSELKNKSVITSLMLRHFPEEYWGFVVNYFIHNTYRLVLNNEIKHPIVIVMREVGDFIEGMTNSPQEMAVKNSIIHVVRKGRKHRLFFWMDNQTPLNLDNVKNEFKIKICHKVDNTVTLKEALGDLGSMLLVHDDYARLMNFNPGRCFVLTDYGLFNPQMMPPLSRMSGQEGVNFFQTWRSEKGSRFKNIKQDIDAVEDEYDASTKKWKDMENERKLKIRAKKEAIKTAKEQEVLAKEEEKRKQRLISEQERELRKTEKNSQKVEELQAKKLEKMLRKANIEEPDVMEELREEVNVVEVKRKKLKFL